MTAKKGNDQVLLLLNQGIAKVLKSGEYDRIYDKWFGHTLQSGYSNQEVAGIVIVVVIAAALIVGIVVFWNWTLRRVVARRTAALSESEASLARAQHIALLGNWRCEFVGRKISFSDEAVSILGIDPDFFSGTCADFRALAALEDRQLLENTITECARTGLPTQCEFHLANGAGAGKILMFHAERETENPLYLCGTIQDITARKRIEEQVRELNQNLEAKVAARTRELEETHEKLIRQERMAALGQLTGVVAHELRNPIGVITSGVDLLGLMTADISNDQLDQAFERIRRNIFRCDRIISELLDYSRVEGTEKSETVLDEWMEQVLSDIDVPAEISLDVLFHAPGTSVGIDRSQMRRVLINLIENACQAMEAEAAGGSDKKHAITLATSVKDDRLRIEITDNGPGIPVEIQPRVFEPLFSTKSFGVGLGLPIVRQIVELHGGKLELKSEPGEGCFFAIEFPKNGQAKKRPAA
jgi:signal transduction histidine kinase